MGFQVSENVSESAVRGDKPIGMGFQASGNVSESIEIESESAVRGCEYARWGYIMS